MTNFINLISSDKYSDVYTVIESNIIFNSNFNQYLDNNLIKGNNTIEEIILTALKGSKGNINSEEKKK